MWLNPTVPLHLMSPDPFPFPVVFFLGTLSLAISVQFSFEAVRSFIKKVEISRAFLVLDLSSQVT